MSRATVLKAAAEDLNLRPLLFQIGQTKYLTFVYNVTVTHNGQKYEYTFRAIIPDRYFNIFFYQLSPPDRHPHYNGETHFCFGDNEETLRLMYTTSTNKENAKAFLTYMIYLTSLYTRNAYAAPNERRSDICACITGSPQSRTCPACMLTCEITGISDTPDNFVVIEDPYTRSHIIHKNIHPSMIKYCALCLTIVPMRSPLYTVPLCEDCMGKYCEVCGRTNELVRVCNVDKCPRKKQVC